MTSTTPELTRPELGEAHGQYGTTTSRSGHVSNLLARSTVASSSGLTHETIRKMRRHYQVASCLLVQSLPLIRADWSIECEDDRIREAMTIAYRRVAFDVHRTLTRALWAGYSPNTLTWNYLADVGIVFPTEVRDLEPRTCSPDLDENGTLAGMVQRSSGVPDDPFDPVYVLWVVEGMEAGNYYGRSLLDAALDPWADYAAIRAFHARYLERFGEPVVIARAPAGKTIGNAGEIQAATYHNEEHGLEPGDTGYMTPPPPVLEDNVGNALRMGESLRHHSVVALPSTLLFGADGKPTGYAWNLEFLEAKGGSGDDFLSALRETEKRIARAMFVPDLLASNGGESGGGAYALGQTHRGVWSDSVEGRLDDYSRQVTAQLLEPARRLNYGENSAPVRLVFAPLSDEQRERTWSLVTALVEDGRLPVDARALAAEVGLPLLDDVDVATTPDPDDDDLGHAHPPAALGRTDGRIALASDDPVAGLPEWKYPQAYDPPPFARALNNREERVGFAALEDGLNQAEATYIAQVNGLLDVEHDRVLRQLSAIMKKGTEAEILTALGTIELKGTAATAKAWGDLMGDVGRLATERVRDELADYANVLPFDVGPRGRAMFRSYATTSAERALTALTTEIRLGLLNAYTSSVSRAGMAAIVAQAFDAYQGSEGKPVRLTTRMLSAKSLNYSRADAVERGGIPLAGAQYSAVLDRRTCDLCAELDQQIIPIEHVDLSRFTPPVHHNCRCLWVWITREEADFTPTWSTPAASKVGRFGGLVI